MKSSGVSGHGQVVLRLVCCVPDDDDIPLLLVDDLLAFLNGIVLK